MKVGEFVVELLANANTVTLKQFGSELGQLPLKSVAAIAALAGVSWQLKEMAGQAMDTALRFQDFSAKTGLSWQELQKWEIVAKQANVSAENVASSIESIARASSDIRMGKGNVAPFQMLGIDPSNNPFKILEQLREKVKDMNRPTAVNLLSQMGISPDMMKVLTLSDEKFRSYSKTVKGLSADQVESLQKAKLALVQLGMVAQQVGATVVTHLVRAFETMKTALQGVTLYMPALVVAVGALVIAFAPVTAAIVGLLLLFDDLASYMRGDGSVIGDMLDAFEKIKNKGGTAGNTLKGMTGGMPGLSLMDVLPGGGSAASAARAAQWIVNQNNTVTIHGGGSPTENAEAAGRYLGRNMRDSMRQFRNK